MEKEEFIQLLDRYLEGIATPEEEILIQRYLDSFQVEGNQFPGDISKIRSSVFSRVEQAVKPDIAGKLISLRRRLLRIAAAAAVILMAGVGVYFVLNNSEPKQLITSVNSENNLIKPGKEGAILTLANGEEYVLDSIRNGIIATETGDAMTLNNGELSYAPAEIQFKDVAHDDAKLLFHTLKTPRGRQFTLQLPDGTKVWLNASSSVKFPISFGAGPRIVEVTGEAYFEVARVNYSGVTNATELNSNQSSGYIPFVVHTNNQTIKVLGTHFNVNSYEDEDGERTTLLEGSVWVGPRRTEGGLPVSDQLNNAGGILLKPGQQVMFAAQGNSGDLQPTIINEVDTDKVVAWKNGFFAFNSADLQMVMRQIARWYDVDVKYEGNIHARFSGSVYRSEDFSELLKVIGFACNVKFKINHKTVTVYSD